MTFIKKYTKTISYIALIVLILSIIPLMILGFFVHPVGDDYYYAKEAVFAYKSTGNFLSIFPAATPIIGKLFITTSKNGMTARYFTHFTPFENFKIFL